MSYREIWRAKTAFGGFKHRVTANETWASYQTMRPSSFNWNTIARMPRDVFDKLAEEKGIWDVYNWPVHLDSLFEGYYLKEK